MTSRGDNASCCGKRTGLEKFLIFGSCFLVLAVVGLVVGIIVISLEHKQDKEQHAGDGENSDKVCYSNGCIHTANTVLQNMDQDVDPCEDFHNFACGNFLKETVIPDDKASVSMFNVINDDLEIKLRTIFKGLKDKQDKHATLLYQLFTSCQDAKAIETAGLQEVKDMINNKLGGWPVVVGDGWGKPFDWQEFSGKLRQLGHRTDYILSFEVDVDMKNTKKNRIQLDQPSLGIAREFLIEGVADDKVKAYKKFMVEVAKLFGATSNNIENELEDSLKLEIQLAEISLSREDRRDYEKLYHLKTITKIGEEYPVVTNWKKYIEDVLNIPGANVDDEVNVAVPKFFEDLKGVMDGATARVIHNYVIWRVIFDSIPYLNNAIRNIELEFLTEMKGITDRPKRWKECVATTLNLLPIATGSEYVQKHFKNEARVSSQIMVKDIGDQFKKILENNEWMDNETRQKAIGKANKMTNHIAYPDELVNVDKLSEYYKDITFIEGESYVTKVLKMQIFGANTAYKELNKEVDKTHWTHHAKAATVNAFYNPIFNSIEFPAGILQGVFFDHDRPRYMNYGAIGFVIGHEITHGFDDQGKQFDQDGNLMDWWNADTTKSFIEKAKCIIEQYGNYVVEEIEKKLNGKNTQGENIADNGGIKEAYMGYKASVERDGKEARLPGLQKYSPEQMFWISAGNVWCTKYTKQALELQVTTGVHSPGRFRVIGPFSNSEYFLKDFGCGENAKMNRKNKCVVW